MQNFIKEYLIASWNTFNRFVQLCSALEIFSCCMTMRPPTKLCLPIFDQRKCYNPLSPPVLSRFISVRLFSVPQVENEVRRTPLCGCCWDPRSSNWWTKECPKRNFRQLFRNCTIAQKPVYMPMELILNKKKVCVFLVYLRFFKKSVQKLLDRNV